jgi:hypothetical protein
MAFRSSPLARRLLSMAWNTTRVPQEDLFTRARDALDLWDDRRLAAAGGPDIGPLPPGWEIRASAVHYLGAPGQSAYYLQVLQHPSGGWLLVYALAEHDALMLVIAHDGFEDFYTAVEQYAAGTHPGDPIKDKAFWLPARAMVRTFIAEHYDPTHEVEAAEQTVVALGGQPHVLPAALLP